MTIPATLLESLRPVTIVAGHYGVGKTNFTCNLALDLKDKGFEVTVIDLDIVNPYFRASEQHLLFEDRGIRLIAPVFADAGTSLDVPSLRGSIGPAIEGAKDGAYVIVDAGGDDVGITALARFRALVKEKPYCMLGILNRYRNLVQDPFEAIENLREIEAASSLAITALVDNSHLQHDTDAAAIAAGYAYADEISGLMGLPLCCVTIPNGIELPDSEDVFGIPDDKMYHIETYVKTPWE